MNPGSDLREQEKEAPSSFQVNPEAEMNPGSDLQEEEAPSSFQANPEPSPKASQQMNPGSDLQAEEASSSLQVNPEPPPKTSQQMNPGSDLLEQEAPSTFQVNPEAEMNPGSDLQEQEKEAPSSFQVNPEPPPSAERPWPDLPLELLGCVYNGLSPSHRINFARVCRSWRQYSSSHPSFPLLMTAFDEVEKGYFRSPFHNNVYLPYHSPEAVPMLCRGSIGCWLLLFRNADRKLFFVHSPFNNERVDLPPWRWPWSPTWDASPTRDAIISAAPNDPAGCSVAFLVAKKIIHCKVGDAMWSACNVDTCLEKSTGAFLDGELYVVDEHQRLGVVNFKDRKSAVTWLVMDLGPLQEQLNVAIVYGAHFLMESSGTLLLTLLGKWASWYVFRADLGRMTWWEVEDLGDRSLFLAPDRSVSAVAVEVGVEANRLYLARAVSAQAPLVDWMTVAAHRWDNMWAEISRRRYWSSTLGPERPSRWVFQRVAVVVDETRA